MGRSKTEDFVFSLTLLTSPSSLLGFTSWISTRGHEFLGEFFVYYQDDVSNLEVGGRYSPLLPLLQARKVFP